MGFSYNIYNFFNSIFYFCRNTGSRYKRRKRKFLHLLLYNQTATPTRKEKDLSRQNLQKITIHHQYILLTINTISK